MDLEPHFDVLVIGGGILGAICADLASSAGERVLLLRRKDRPVAFAETLRNQAWFQSGGFYSRDPELARRLAFAGRELVRRYFLKLDEQRGVFALTSPASLNDEVRSNKARENLRRMHELMTELGHDIEQLSDSRARDLLHGAYRPTSIHYHVPDTRFPEARVLESARKQAEAQGAHLREIEDEVTLVKREDGRYLVQVGGQVWIAPKKVIIAAGAGTLRLLEKLSIAHDLCIRRVPMLIAEHGHPAFPPVFADRENKIMLTSHITASGPRLIFGSNVEEICDSETAARRVKRAESMTLRSMCPLATPGKSRFVTGYEPVRQSDKYAEHFARDWTLVEGSLVAATPGRATYALRAAMNVMQKLGIDVQDRPRPPRRTAIVGLPGEPWRGKVVMYYESPYDGTDEGEEGGAA